MVAQVLAFLGSLFNLVIDTIYKIGLTLLVLFLGAIALAFGFAVLIIYLVT
jgi:hypothetical protein